MIKALIAATLVVGLSACANPEITSTLDTQAPRAEHIAMQNMVTEYAKAHGITPAFARAVVHVESRYRCNAIGKAGERGIMQVKPATARGVGVTGNLLDCSVGLTAGMRYLNEAIKRAGGENCAAASLYNRGIYARPICTGYGRKVVQLTGR
jgi:soluble lytic murein transglycosylase-like protein